MKTATIDCNVYCDGDDNWYFAVWVDGEYDTNGEIDDASSESDAVAWALSQWPQANVSVIDPVI